MANPLDEGLDPKSQLPPAELNPLLNPTLGHNLGRWAEVYITSPPEQRDDALGKLLRELESGPSETLRQPEQSIAENSTPVRERSPESELDWLRSRNFSLAYQSSGAQSRWVWKILAPVLALVLAGFAYSQWRTWQIGAQPRELQSAALKTATSQSAAEEQATPFIPSASPAAVNAAADAQIPAVSGLEELRRAQEYLEGKRVPRDSAAAADWLWRAVRKENSTATWLLADLYLQGDGVPKNCEQARLLLAAAASRGNPQAAEKLRELEWNGCA